jgi:uncharacterized membrane protein YecN with MAPEG domain
MIPEGFPSITAATAVILATLQMFLMLYVARGRGKYKTGLGDGGHDGLIRRIRIHGNLSENAPLFLILLALVETSGQWSMFVPFFALGFVVFRVSHALGLTISAGPSVFRFVGVVGTLFAILGLAALLVVTLARDTSWLPHLLH